VPKQRNVAFLTEGPRHAKLAATEPEKFTVELALREVVKRVGLESTDELGDLRLESLSAHPNLSSWYADPIASSAFANSSGSLSTSSSNASSLNCASVGRIHALRRYAALSSL